MATAGKMLSGRIFNSRIRSRNVEGKEKWKGYHFAGWQTKAEITENDIVNGVSKYLWLFGDKLSTTGVAKFNAMSDADKEARKISEEVMLLDSADVDGVVTLYARWVQEKEISDAQGLKDIAKDLYGAYKLTADITLTGEWESIGAYFANYEYYNTEWWTYAFRGTLNGNGHTVSGLNITSAELNKNYAAEGSPWHDDGVTCDGTAAMFSALASANISNLTIASPVINVAYSGDAGLSEKIAASFRHVFTDGMGTLKKEFQTGYVLPLAFGLAEGAERETMAQNLDRLVRERGYHLSTGFTGTPHILFALADGGKAETAYKLLLQDTAPSWLYCIKEGATTTWEEWTIDPQKEGNIPSYNHYAYGAVGDFLYRRVAGIEPTEGGYKCFSVRPVLGGGLTFAKASVKTPYGMAASEWHLSGGKFILKVTVPVSCTCRVTMPKGKQMTLQSGEYEWEEEV